MPDRNNPDRRGRYTRHADRDLSQPRKFEHKDIFRLARKWQTQTPEHRAALIVTFDEAAEDVAVSVHGNTTGLICLLYELCTRSRYAAIIRRIVLDTEGERQARDKADRDYAAAYEAAHPDTDSAPDIPVGNKEKAPASEAAKPSLLQRILHYLFPGIK